MTTEPFYTSVRFWTALLTPIVAALLPALVEKLPFVGTLSAEQWVALFAGGVVSGVTFIIARTLRNVKRVI